MVHFVVDIVSDTVCPWCYVGLRRLQAAIGIYTGAGTGTTSQSAIAGAASANTPAGGHTFTINWHPYYLNPGSPDYPGTPKQAFYSSKFGPNLAQQMQYRIGAVGQSVGINFKHGGMIGNTRDSHRLIYFVGRVFPGVSSEGGAQAGTAPLYAGNQFQNALVEQIFKLSFENEGNITDREELVDCVFRAYDALASSSSSSASSAAPMSTTAAEIKGVSRKSLESLIRAYLFEEESLSPSAKDLPAGIPVVTKELTREFDAVVDREVENARTGGVTGVPDFKISSKGGSGKTIGVGGAQDPETFVQIFRKLEKDVIQRRGQIGQGHGNGAPSGNVGMCTRDGEGC